MERQILIGGEAGQGVAKAATIMGKAFVREGFYVFNYRDYPSLIKGGHNFNVLRISAEPVSSHEFDGHDVVVALDEKTVRKHAGEMKKDAVVLAPNRVNADSKLSVDTENIIRELNAPKIMENIILISAAWKYLGMPFESLEKTILEELKNNRTAVTAAKRGYEEVETGKVMGTAPEKRARYFITGSQAVAMGAIAAGIDLYIAYPMTPATPVLHYLAAVQTEYDFQVLQLENEIAVANAALGASYAGAMTMIGTSGGGFALMGEAMSLQGMSEVPLVAYLAMRNAPSTGVPTYTGQGDLKMAVNIGHGEYPKVVVAPGDPKEVFERTLEAFYLAYKYRVLSIIISDKHLAESTYTVDGFSPRVEPERFIVEDVPEDYKSYEITETGVSPRAVPGQGDAPVRATSYEHDEYGYTREEGEWAIKMNDKRFRKVRYIKEEVASLEPVNTYGNGDKVIVSWGSTKGAILDALKQLDGWRFVQVSYIEPFPAEQFLDAVEGAERIVLVENNVTGLLGDIIAEKTGMIIEEKILRYDARPFTPKYILRRL
ncbi:MAG TPA: 2-oxoacid:acceptor oxidoreductase subunit alpha [Euryarchaeota archaeon]|nr:2-oxoacid:acceptor oxidoreductase subunit alpha [Euryarchaeota archaeon]